MADEKVNASPEEKKAPEAPAPSGPGDPPAPEHTEGPAVPGGDQTAPAHVEPAMPEKTEEPIKPEQSVIPGMGEDAPAPSGKVINLSDIQAADKGGKEASAPAPEKKAPEADKPPKRRGRLWRKSRKRRSPAQAARLRLTRRPVRRLRPLFRTKCPEVRKPTRARKRVPAVRLRLNPLRRQSRARPLLSRRRQSRRRRSSCRPRRRCRPARWKREKSSI